MKIPVVILLLAGMLFGGCGAPVARGAEQMPRSDGNAVESAAPESSGVTETVSGPLTREQAEAIALEHAGFTADQVSRLRTEYEIDDGVPHFEVRFRQGRWEYDYEIEAETGAILSYDRDD